MVLPSMVKQSLHDQQMFLICSKISSDTDFLCGMQCRQPKERSQVPPNIDAFAYPLCLSMAEHSENSLLTGLQVRCDATSEIRLERLSLPSYTLSSAFFHSPAHLLQGKPCCELPPSPCWQATLLTASHGKGPNIFSLSQQGLGLQQHRNVTLEADFFLLLSCLR